MGQQKRLKQFQKQFNQITRKIERVEETYFVEKYEVFSVVAQETISDEDKKRTANLEQFNVDEMQRLNFRGNNFDIWSN